MQLIGGAQPLNCLIEPGHMDARYAPFPGGAGVLQFGYQRAARFPLFGAFVVSHQLRQTGAVVRAVRIPRRISPIRGLPKFLFSELPQQFVQLSRWIS